MLRSIRPDIVSSLISSRNPELELVRFVHVNKSNKFDSEQSFLLSLINRALYSLFLGIYLATFLAITTTSIIATVIVLHVHHMGTRRVPKILKRIMFDVMARALFMNGLVKKYGTSSCNQNQTSSPLQSSLNSVYLTTARNPTLIRDGKPYRHSPKEQRRLLHNGRIITGMKKSLSETEDQIAQQVLVQRNYVLEEILIHIKALTAERSYNEHDEARKQEWIAVAKVLDRFFMVAFILSISISSIIILVVMPNNKVSQFQQ